MAIEQLFLSEFFSVPHLRDIGRPFIMVISEDPWHSHLSPESLAVELSLPVFTTFYMRGESFNLLLHRRGR